MIQTLGRHNRHWQGVPIVDYPDTEEVTPIHRANKWLVVVVTWNLADGYRLVYFMGICVQRSSFLPWYASRLGVLFRIMCNHSCFESCPKCAPSIHLSCYCLGLRLYSWHYLHPQSNANIFPHEFPGISMRLTVIPQWRPARCSASRHGWRHWLWLGSRCSATWLRTEPQTAQRTAAARPSRPPPKSGSRWSASTRRSRSWSTFCCVPTPTSDLWNTWRSVLPARNRPVQGDRPLRKAWC